MNSFDPFATPISTAISVCVFVLAVATLLMPLYVISMHGWLKRMTKEVELMRIEMMKSRPDMGPVVKQLELAVPRVMKMQEDLAKLRKLWTEGAAQAVDVSDGPAKETLK